MRSTKLDSEFAPVASGVVAPVCGSGQSWTSFTDTTAADDTPYFYAVQSVNAGSCGAQSTPSTSATPTSQLSASAPDAPAKVSVAKSGHHEVALTWSASPGAKFYSVWRTTLHPDNVGGTYPLRTIFMDETTGTSFNDHSPTDGRIYSYHITAVNAVPLPAAACRCLPHP